MIDEMRDDPCLTQAANVACLPGILGYSLAMPDIHLGLWFPHRRRRHSRGGLAEEMPQAYKNVTKVVEVMEAAGVTKRVARLRPLAVIKG